MPHFLTQHFSFEELTRTDTGLPNDPRPTRDITYGRLVLLAMFLEKVRSGLGAHPLVVHSAYRSLVVNEAVGGVRDSAHREGYACDFTIDGMTPLEAARGCQQLRREGRIEYDQLILEQLPNPTWVHISRDPRVRMEDLTLDANGYYVAGILSS